MAAVVLVAVLATACTGDDPRTPEETLVQTVRDTFDGSFAYRVVAEADREALDALGDLASVAARLDLFELTGVVDGDVSSLDVQVFGTAPLLQLRRFSDDETHLRLGLSEGPFASLLTPELEGRVLGVAVQTDQPEAIVTAIGALFDGDWIHLAGPFDASLLRGGPSPGTTSTPPETPAGAATPVPDLVAEYLTVADRVDTDGRTTYRVDLQVRDLLRTLADLGGGAEAAGVQPQDLEDGLSLLPRSITGDVVVGDGVVRAVVFDVAAAAREDGVDIDGALELRLELSDHGRPSLPRVPDSVATVQGTDLAAGLRQLLVSPPPMPDGGLDVPSEAATDAP